MKGLQILIPSIFAGVRPLVPSQAAVRARVARPQLGPGLLRRPAQGQGTQSGCAGELLGQAWLHFQIQVLYQLHVCCQMIVSVSEFGPYFVRRVYLVLPSKAPSQSTVHLLLQVQADCCKRRAVDSSWGQRCESRPVPFCTTSPSALCCTSSGSFLSFVDLLFPACLRLFFLFAMCLAIAEFCFRK